MCGERWVRRKLMPCPVALDPGAALGHHLNACDRGFSTGLAWRGEGGRPNFPTCGPSWPLAPNPFLPSSPPTGKGGASPSPGCWAQGLGPNPWPFSLPGLEHLVPFVFLAGHSLLLAGSSVQLTSGIVHGQTVPKQGSLAFLVTLIFPPDL